MSSITFDRIGNIYSAPLYFGALTGIAASNAKIAAFATPYLTAAQPYLTTGLTYAGAIISKVGVVAAAHPVAATLAAAIVIYNIPPGTIRNTATRAVSIFANGCVAFAAYKAAPIALPLLSKAVTVGLTFAGAHPFLITALAMGALLRYKDNEFMALILLGAPIAYTFPYTSVGIAVVTGLFFAIDKFFPEQTQALVDSVDEFVTSVEDGINNCLNEIHV